MEPIGTVAKELKGVLERADGSRIAVHATIFAPSQSIDQSYHSCVVHCPFLFHDDKQIAGVDPDQAVELSVVFVRELWESKGVLLIDESGTMGPSSAS